MKVRLAVLFAALGILAFLALLPLLYMVSTALKTFGETITRISPNPLSLEFWPRIPQWANFAAAWSYGEGLAHSFFVSVVVASVTVLGVLATTIPAAYAFAKIPFRGREFFFGVFLTTLMVPETVSTLANFMTITRLGWINSLQGLTVPFFASSFFIFFLRQYFRQIPETILEAAQIDGATTFQVTLRIAVPAARAPIFTVAFLAFTGSWNSLMWPLMATNTLDWRPLAVGLTKFVTEAGPQAHLSMAASTMALAPIVLIYIIAQKQITDSVTRSGIVG